MVPVRSPAALLLIAGLFAAALPAPAAGDAPYTDHFGVWHFTAPAPLDAALGPGLESILLRLNDGTGFTAFIPGVPMDLARALPYQVYRPPLLYFECYEDFDTGNLFIRGEQTQIAGSCTQNMELVDGQLRHVVRFAGYDVPVNGIGFYCLELHCDL